MSTLDEQDALMTGEKEVVVAVLVVPAVPAVNLDKLLAPESDDEWELEGAVGLEEIERVGLKSICASYGKSVVPRVERFQRLLPKRLR